MSVPGRDTRVTRRAVTAFAIRAASAGVAYASHVLLARWLSLDQYGLFAATWTWLLIAGGTLPLGLNAAVVSRMPGYLAAGDAAHARGLAVMAAGVTLALSVFVSVAALVLFTWYPGLAEGVVGPLAVLAVLCIPLLALAEINEGLARAMGWMGSALVPAYIARPLLMLAAGGILLAWGVELDAAAVLACALLAAAATTTVQAGWVAFRLIQSTGWGPPRMAPRTWFLISLPMLVSEISELLLGSLDLLFVAAAAGSAEAGIYFAAQRSIALVAFVSFAVGAATASSVASAAAEPARLPGELRRAATMAFWPTLIGALLLVAAAPYVLALFGPEFGQGTTVVAILAAGFVARSFVGPADMLLNAIGAERACALILAAHLVLALGLNVVLVPAFGIAGAAAASSATMVSMSAAFAAYAWFARGLVLAPSMPLPDVVRLARSAN